MSRIQFQRAMLLQHQGRHAEAEKELRQMLAANPQDAQAHAALSLCLSEQKRYPEATQEAQWSIGLAPDQPFCHYAHAVALLARNHFAEAESAIRQAIHLHPYDPDFFAMLGSIHAAGRRWQPMLDAADQGLAIDPEHENCTNLRAMALVNLGRRQEAGATLGDAISKNPQSAFSHANQGWALLHKGDHRKALEHFTESLRLDPGYDWARLGLVEALKARNIIYRWLLMYFLWISRLSPRTQFGILVVGYIAYRIVLNTAQSESPLAPWLWPLVIAYIIFAIMTWLADPLFNLLLRLNRFGRYALSPEQKTTSELIGWLLLLCLGAIAWAFVSGDPRFIEAATVLGFLILPASVVLKCERGWPRRVMVLTLLGLACVGGLAVYLLFAGKGYPSTEDPMIRAGDRILGLFIYGSIASQFLAAVLVQVRRRT